ncbi:amidase [Maricaulis maris]|uniref:Asp-tRNA(Asn)/Glu-tRNA(Gln) amidotransferase A subunit family amidase n=1 Tax=Maricaulis maris TaxID=74318 RepID=A0A495D4F6_9PROT|nr:amidase [Maricaulis maris]RKQ95669.1 Asp-tRNA(Asn)/Glu-tRNA(Gln) amidotransferase A subunit family amidase [Maricaulis maris]
MTDRKTSRRDLLKGGAFAVVSAGATGAAMAGQQSAAAPASQAAAGPVSPQTLQCAESLFDIHYTDAEREQVVQEIDGWIDRMTRQRAHEKPNTLSPATVFDPRLRSRSYRDQPDRVVPSNTDAGALPASDTMIAFAPVWKQAAWMRRGLLTSRRLTDIYLDRIERHGAALECFVTVTPEIARAEADQADRELAAGQDRGPLHGIPYGMKDIIDVAGVRASWGATPFQDRVAEVDATIAVKLREAGAVLLGKTTNGALAYGDRWFGGITRNPWNTEEGSSGSSAGSASATAAGLVAFGIGTETLGSIVSPSNRCGTTGLRPTFGRVSRHGAMALCWSLDKIGPICRSVEDTGFVLAALNGYDAADAGSLGMGLEIDAGRPVAGMRVGYDPAWFEAGTEADRAALQAARDAGVELVEIALPDLPYDGLFAVVEAESAAAFEQLTLSGEDDSLVWQDTAAWPNTWRRARFISAVDLINVDRFRREVMEMMDSMMDGLDVMIGPNFAGAMLLITNYTGHPQLAFKSGYNQLQTRTIFGDPVGEDAPTHRVPQTTSLWAPLFEEGNLIALGREIERRLAVADDHPPAFL